MTECCCDEAWCLFQREILAAIGRSENEYDDLMKLVADLALCESTLREGSGNLLRLGRPAATELSSAMTRYEWAGRPGGYDDVHAANIILAVAKALRKDALEQEETQ